MQTVPFGFFSIEHKGVDLAIWVCFDSCCARGIHQPRGIHPWSQDTAGTERYMSCSQVYLRNAVAVVMVYDVTDAVSFEKLGVFWDMVTSTAAPDCITVLCGNKVDLVEDGVKPQAVTEVDARHLVAERKACRLLYTSAKTGQNITEIFDTVCEALTTKGIRYDSGSASVIRPAAADDAAAKRSGGKPCCAS
jgi:small GTP-binding protein